MTPKESYTITEKENEEILQRLLDTYGEDYLQGTEWHDAYNQLLDGYLHDDTLFIYKK